MTRWRLNVTETPNDAYMNMAIEEAIPRARSIDVMPNTLRLWRNANAVVIGYAQEMEEEVRVERCKESNVQMVRRFTGGGAVYHDLGNLNYSITFKDHEPISAGKIEDKARFLCSGIVSGLREIGIDAVSEGISAIKASGKKISGLAQSYRWGVLFVHGCLLVSTDLHALEAVLRHPTSPMGGAGSEGIESSATNVEDAIGRKIDMARVAHAIIVGFGEILDDDLVPSGLTDRERALAESLRNGKYIQSDWNYRRPSEQGVVGWL